MLSVAFFYTMIYGINAPSFTNIDYSQSQFEKGFNHLLELGIQSIRIPLIWSKFFSTNPKTGKSIPNPEEFIKYSRVLRFLPIEIKLLGFICCPPQSICENYFYDQSSLANKVKEFVQLLCQYQISFSDWEIGNEPNASDFYLSVYHEKWEHKPWTPKQYMYDFVIPGINAIKEYFPESKICIGALAGNGIIGHTDKKIPISNLQVDINPKFNNFKSSDPHGQFYFISNFAQELIRVYSNLDKNVKETISAFSFHPYPYFNIPKGLNYSKYSIQLVASLLEETEKVEDFPELWITEVGIRTLDVKNNYKRDLKSQSEFLTDFSNSDLINSKISKIYWYKYMDSGFDLINEKTFGIVDRFQNPKPAFHHLKRSHLQYKKSVSHFVDSFSSAQWNIDGVIDKVFWQKKPVGDQNLYNFIEYGIHQEGRNEITIFPGRNENDATILNLEQKINVLNKRMQLGMYYNVSDYNTSSSIVWNFGIENLLWSVELTNTVELSWKFSLLKNKQELKSWLISKDYVEENILPFLRYIEFGFQENVFYAKINFTAYIEVFNFVMETSIPTGDYKFNIEIKKNDNKPSFIKISDFYLRSELFTQIPLLNFWHNTDRYRYYHQDESKYLFYSWAAMANGNPDLLYFLELSKDADDSNVGDLRKSKFWKGIELRQSRQLDHSDQGIFMQEMSDAFKEIIKISLSKHIHCCHITYDHSKNVKSIASDLNVFSFCLTGKIEDSENITNYLIDEGYQEIIFPTEKWYYKSEFRCNKLILNQEELRLWSGFQGATRLLENFNSGDQSAILNELSKDFYQCIEAVNVRRIESYLETKEYSRFRNLSDHILNVANNPDTIGKLLLISLKHKKSGLAIRCLNRLIELDLQSFLKTIQEIATIKSYLESIRAFLNTELNKKNNPTLYRYFFQDKLNNDKRVLKLHIGTYKTGTTSIQANLYKEKENLASKNISYPEIGKFVRSAHFELYDFLKGEIDPKIIRDLNGLVKENKIIISCEHFVNLEEGELNKLLNFYLDHKVEIIIFIRNWCHSIYSHWNESIKHGFSFSISEYYNKVVQEDFQNSRFNHYSVLAKYQRLIPKENFKIVLYDSILESEQSLCDYFFEEILELDSGPQDLKFYNKKLKPVDLDIIRIQNFLYQAKYKIEPKAEVRKRYLNLISTKQFIPSGKFIEKRTQKLTNFKLTGKHSFFQKIENSIKINYKSQIINGINTENNIDELFKEHELEIENLDIQKFINISEVKLEMEKLHDQIMDLDE